MTVVRVHHVITSLDVGGAEMMLAKIVGSAMPGVEHSITSLLPAGAIANRIPDGVPVGTAGMRRVTDVAAGVAGVRRAVRRFAPHVIHGWMYHGNLAASVASISAPRRVLWNVRQALTDLGAERRTTQWVIRASAPFSHRVGGIVYNSAIAVGDHARVGFDAARALVIPNGFDADHFAPNASSALEVRKELGIDAGSCVFGHFARVHAVKNHAGYLAAAGIVARALPTARFLMVGRGVPEFVQANRAVVESTGLIDRLIALDERHDVNRLMTACDVVCLTSTLEGFPNVLGEAMACGVPCVATDVGDCRWVVDDCGRVVAEGDMAAFAAACIELGSLAAADRARLGVRARARVLRDFSLPAVAEQYAALYRKAAG